MAKTYINPGFVFYILYGKDLGEPFDLGNARFSILNLV